MSVKPLALLARLAEDQLITPNQRDAGEIFARLGQIRLSDAHDGSNVEYPMRSQFEGWSMVAAKKNAAIEAFEAARAAIRADRPRQVAVCALVAREPSFRDDDYSALDDALTDLGAHFFGLKVPVVAVSRIGNVSVGATAIHPPVAANDNDADLVAGTRVMRSPFFRMFERGQLDDDEAINEILYSAGLRYYQDWYHGGMAGGLGSFDYSKPLTDGGGGEATHMPRTMREASHRVAYRKAVTILTTMERRMVEAVVLNEKPISDVARAVTGISDRNKYMPAGKATLITALGKLARYYGLIYLEDAA